MKKKSLQPRPSTVIRRIERPPSEEAGVGKADTLSSPAPLAPSRQTFTDLAFSSYFNETTLAAVEGSALFDEAYKAGQLSLAVWGSQQISRSPKIVCFSSTSSPTPQRVPLKAYENLKTLDLTDRDYVEIIGILTAKLLFDRYLEDNGKTNPMPGPSGNYFVTPKVTPRLVSPDKMRTSGKPSASFWKIEFVYRSKLL